MKIILVIDDTLEMRENIAEILKLAQYAVVTADTGKQGVELARQTRPDLILCDIMMPDLDGYGLLHILRRDAATAGIPFIFLSARAGIADFRAGMDLGADDYLIKPFDNVALLNAVSLRIGKAKKQLKLDRLDPLRDSIINGSQGAQRLAEIYPSKQLRKKHVLFQTGSIPTDIYYVHRGQVKLVVSDEAGNTFITRMIGEGDFVGYLALLRNSVYLESAELITDAEISQIPKDDFHTLVRNNQEIANHFIRLLAVNVSDGQERLLKLAYQSVRKRVAEALLLVQHKFYGVPPVLAEKSNEVNLPPMSWSRENWSQLVGASTETVIRTLRDFHSEGLIEITGSQIKVLDRQKLKQMKN